MQDEHTETGAARAAAGGPRAHEGEAVLGDRMAEADECAAVAVLGQPGEVAGDTRAGLEVVVGAVGAEERAGIMAGERPGWASRTRTSPQTAQRVGPWTRGNWDAVGPGSPKRSAKEASRSYGWTISMNRAYERRATPTSR